MAHDLGEGSRLWRRLPTPNLKARLHKSKKSQLGMCVPPRAGLINIDEFIGIEQDAAEFGKGV